MKPQRYLYADLLKSRSWMEIFMRTHDRGLHGTPHKVAIVIGYFESCLPNAVKSHAAPRNFLMIGQRET